MIYGKESAMVGCSNAPYEISDDPPTAQDGGNPEKNYNNSAKITLYCAVFINSDQLRIGTASQVGFTTCC